MLKLSSVLINGNLINYNKELRLLLRFRCGGRNVGFHSNWPPQFGRFRTFRSNARLRMLHAHSTRFITSFLAFTGPAAILPYPIDAVTTARTFLEAFASNPSATRKLVTHDAVIVVGDTGGPFSTFMRGGRPKAIWLSTCRADSLKQMPLPPESELNVEDTHPQLKGVKLSVVKGRYSCTKPDGTKGDVELTVILKNSRVAMLGLWPPTDVPRAGVAHAPESKR